MKVIINNKETETTAANVAQLATELALPDKGIAIAINNQLITRSAWGDTPIVSGANIVIIKAFCGG